MRKIRLAIALMILTISILLLIWGYWPSEHEILVQPISPSEMQLPTPSSLNFGLEETV